MVDNNVNAFVLDICLSLGEPHQDVLRVYSWLCTQGLFLAKCVAQIEPRSTVYKELALPAVLYLLLQDIEYSCPLFTTSLP